MSGSRALIIIALVALGSIVVAQGDPVRSFIGETDILVLPQGAQASDDAERIIGDAEQIAYALKFYDVMLRTNTSIEDRFAGQSDADRKAGWDAALSVTRQGESGMLAVKVMDQDPAQARILSEQTARDIVAVMSRYHGREGGVDVRIVDDTVVSPSRRFFGLDVAALSGIMTIILGVCLFFLPEGVRQHLSLPRRGSWDPSKPPEETFFVRNEEMSDMPEKSDDTEWAESFAQKTIPATEEEIRQRLNELLSRKVE